MNDDGFEVSAALLRRGEGVSSMVENLASRLERALPDHATFNRGRLRRRSELVIDLDPARFRLELRGSRVQAWVDHVVRGVCVRSETIDFDPWLDRLAGALQREATRSTSIRLALEAALS